MSIKNQVIAGYGGKRPLIYKNNSLLLLDPENPRLPSDMQGRDQEQIKEVLKRYFFLDELAQSMAENGYFDEEPLVGIPESLPQEFENKNYNELKGNIKYNEFVNNEATKFIIVEGNRRLATIKLLVEGKFSAFQTLTQQALEDFEKLPVIVYPKRRDVIAYLGVRHIIGVKKWDAYAKARYIASMKDDHGLTIDEIQKSVGDITNSARKTYICYQLIETLKEEFEDFDVTKAKDNFSYLMLATGQSAIKDYIGLPKKWDSIDSNNPIPKENLDRLKNLFSWLFGEGKERTKVIEESRDITGKLSTVLKDPDATQYLIDHRNLMDAYDRSGGERHLLIKSLKRSKVDLGKALPLIPSNYNEEVQHLISDCKKIIDSMKKLIPE